MTLEENKLTVTEIVNLIHYSPFHQPKPEILAKILEIGKIFHEVLGYNNNKTYERYIKIKFKNKKTGDIREETWRIIGKPDAIEEDKIVEFKTLDSLGYNDANLKELLEAARTQANLYCWLTGLKVYKIKIFIFEREEIRIWEFMYDKQKAVRDIVAAIKLKDYLDILAYKYSMFKDKVLKR